MIGCDAGCCTETRVDRESELVHVCATQPWSEPHTVARWQRVQPPLQRQIPQSALGSRSRAPPLLTLARLLARSLSCPQAPRSRGASCRITEYASIPFSTSRISSSHLRALICSHMPTAITLPALSHSESLSSAPPIPNRSFSDSKLAVIELTPTKVRPSVGEPTPSWRLPPTPGTIWSVSFRRAASMSRYRSTAKQKSKRVLHRRT
jgi:hypothetical protein